MEYVHLVRGGDCECDRQYPADSRIWASRRSYGDHNRLLAKPRVATLDIRPIQRQSLDGIDFCAGGGCHDGKRDGALGTTQLNHWSGEELIL